MNNEKTKSWTPLFNSIMKLLNIGGKILQPNSTTLRLFTGLRIDKIFYFKNENIKCHIINLNSNKQSNKKLNIGEWIWNYKIISNHKKYTHYIFYIHGGAFCAGNTYNVRGFLYNLANISDYIIFSTNYRKSPEYKYPIPLKDCIKAYSYFLKQIKNLDSNTKIIIMGDSAGGNLSINLIAHLIKSNLSIPSGCILISPWVNLTDWDKSESWKSNANYDFVKSELAKFFAFEYIDKSINKLEDVSPFYLPDDILNKFPPMLINCGEYECLRDQIHEFSSKLENLNLNISYICANEMTHNYPLFYFTKIQQADDFFNIFIKFITKINQKN